MAGIPTNVAQLMAVLNLNTLPFEANAAKAAGMMSAGGALAMGAVGLGVIMAGTGIIATKMAGDFQAGLTSLVTGAGESKANLQLVSDGIKQLAMDTGTSTKQLIDGMYMIESGGFHGAAGLAILKAAAEGAKVGSADLGVVADTVDTILKNYGEHGALSATQATNALITTVANGKTHLEDLASSLAMVLPAGAAAGLGMKDVLGAMATLTSVGIPAAESATYLRQMIIALEAPSSGAKTALAGIGITADQVADKMKIGLPQALEFIKQALTSHGIKEGSAQYVAALREISGGTRQMQAMLNLMGGDIKDSHSHLGTFAVDVAKIGGAASKTGNQVTGWALVQQNMNQQFDRFKNVLGVLLINLGQQLLPVATNLFQFLADTALPAVKNLAQWLGDRLGEASKAIAKAWQDLTGKGGALHGAILLLPGILAGVHHYFDLLGQVWREQIQPGLVQMLPVLKIIGIILGVVIVAAIAITIATFLLLVGVITAVIFIFTKLVQGIGWFFQQFGYGIQLVKANIGIFLGHMGELGQNLNKKIHDIINGVLTFFSTLPAKMHDLGMNIIKAIARGMQDARGAVVNAVANIPIIGGIAGGINQFLPKFAAQGGTFGEGEWGVVGENNPEAIRVQNGRAIITPLSGGRIAASPAGAGSGALTGGTITIIVNSTLDGKKVANAVVQHLPAAVRNATGYRH